MPGKQQTKVQGYVDWMMVQLPGNVKDVLYFKTTNQFPLTSYRTTNSRVHSSSKCSNNLVTKISQLVYGNEHDYNSTKGHDLRFPNVGRCWKKRLNQTNSFELIQHHQTESSNRFNMLWPTTLGYVGPTHWIRLIGYYRAFKIGIHQHKRL